MSPIETGTYDNKTLAHDLRIPVRDVRRAREQLGWIAAGDCVDREEPTQENPQRRDPEVGFGRARRQLLIDLREEGYDLANLAANDNGVATAEGLLLNERLAAALEVARCQKKGLVRAKDIAEALGLAVPEVRRAVNDLRYAPTARREIADLREIVLAKEKISA